MLLIVGIIGILFGLVLALVIAFSVRRRRHSEEVVNIRFTTHGLGKRLK